MGLFAQLIPPACDFLEACATQCTDANFPVSLRTPMSGSKVTVTGKPLDKQARMVSQSGFTRGVGLGRDIYIYAYKGLLQGMAYPTVGAG